MLRDRLQQSGGCWGAGYSGLVGAGGQAAAVWWVLGGRLQQSGGSWGAGCSSLVGAEGQTAAVRWILWGAGCSCQVGAGGQAVAVIWVAARGGQRLRAAKCVAVWLCVEGAERAG